MKEYIIVRLVASNKKQVVRFISARVIEDEEVIISRYKGLYFIILPGVEIGMPLRTLKRMIALAQHAMEQEKWV